MKRQLLFAVATGALALGSLSTESASASAAADGRALFAQDCARCHSATSTQSEEGPGLKGLFKRKTLPGSGRPTTEANVRSQILNGGGGMPPFKGTLSTTQVSALIAYLRTL